MKTRDELIAQLAAFAQEFKQIKLSIAAKNPPPNSDAKITFTKEEAQEINAKVNKFDGIKDKNRLDEAGKILAEELKTLIPAFLAKYDSVVEAQKKQLIGLKAKAEAVLNEMQPALLDNQRILLRYCNYTNGTEIYDKLELYSLHENQNFNNAQLKFQNYTDNGIVGANFIRLEDSLLPINATCASLLNTLVASFNSGNVTSYLTRIGSNNADGGSWGEPTKTHGCTGGIGPDFVMQVATAATRFYTTVISIPNLDFSNQTIIPTQIRQIQNSIQTSINSTSASSCIGPYTNFDISVPNIDDNNVPIPVNIQNTWFSNISIIIANILRRLQQPNAIYTLVPYSSPQNTIFIQGY